MANRCYLCLSKEESIDHILLHCVLTRSLRNFLFSLFGVLWVLPYSIREALLGWLGPCVGRRGRKCSFQLPCAFFGLFGRKETIGLLKRRDIRFKGVNHFSFVIFGLQLRGFFYFGPPSFVNFVDWLGLG